MKNLKKDKINGLLNINDFENKIYLKQCYKIISIMII